MENKKKNNIILEEGEIVNFKKLKDIINSGFEKCICKIKKEIKDVRMARKEYGTGFFCNISDKNLKVILTNNHIINNEFLQKERILKLEVEEKEKEINLKLKRYKMSDEELDFTIIEIIKEDNINNFLEIDKEIYTNDYIEEQIFSPQYPGGEDLKYSQGKIIGKKGGLYLYTVGTSGGSSGSPLILFNNLKIIGLQVGCIYEENKYKINLGIPINLIIDAIDSIKCIYKINKEDLEKDIQIINNGYYDFKNQFQECNEEIRNKIKIIVNKKPKLNTMKCKFNEKGQYKIYIIEKEKIKDISCMFNWCVSLISVDFSYFKPKNIAY